MKPTPTGKRTDEASGRGRLLAGWTSLCRVRRVSPWIIAGAQFLSAVSAAPRAAALSEESMEYPLKLAFLYNFTKYVEWPSDSYKTSEDPVSICIIGKD